MKKVINDVHLMIKVCDMHYNQNMNQQQIAKQLELSRPTVSRLLTSAREQGIVTISVSNVEDVKYWDLERQLEDRYHLKEVRIVDSMDAEEERKAALGRVAGHCLEYLIQDNGMVGISMGSTLYEVVSHIHNPLAENVTVVPLIGGMGELRTELHSNHLAEMLSKIYGGRFIPLHAPARVSSVRSQKALMKESSLKSTFKQMGHLDVAIVGIGYPGETSAIKATGYFKENEIESLKKRNVAGDICMQFFDRNGNTELYKSDNMVIGMDIHKLKKVPDVVGVAGGTTKLEAVLGAIKGGYINHLITDYDCAKALFNESQE